MSWAEPDPPLVAGDITLRGPRDADRELFVRLWSEPEAVAMTLRKEPSADELATHWQNVRSNAFTRRFPYSIVERDGDPAAHLSSPGTAPPAPRFALPPA